MKNWLGFISGLLLLTTGNIFAQVNNPGGRPIGPAGGELSGTYPNPSILSGAVSTTKLGGDITAAGKSLLDDADATAQRATLGLGTAATQNTGTSGATIPLLNGTNTWSNVQTTSSTIQKTDPTNGVVIAFSSNANGALALGSITQPTAPYLDFRSTGTLTPGARLTSTGADSFTISRGSIVGQPMLSLNGSTTAVGINDQGWLKAGYLSASRDIAYSSTAPAAGAAWNWSQGGMSGTMTPGAGGITSPNAIYITGDNTTSPSAKAVNALHILYGTGGANVNSTRQGILAEVSLTASVPADVAIVGGQFGANIHKPFSGLSGGFAQSKGSAFGDNPQAIAWTDAGDARIRRLTSTEMNASVQKGVTTSEFYGATIIATGDHSNRGVYDDATLLIGNQVGAMSQRYGLLFSSGRGMPTAMDGTLIGLRGATRPYFENTGFIGIDLRGADWSNLAYASRNFTVDGVGEAKVKELKTANKISAELATVTGATIKFGGLFFGATKPTITIDAPNTGVAGATAATISVTTMAVFQHASIGIASLNTAGTGYSVNDILTVSGGTSVTPTRLRVTAVGGSGNITSIGFQDSGYFSALPTYPASVTGGTGSGATVTLITDARGIQGIVAGGTGYSVNDVLTLTGGTGTPATVTVTAVNSGVITAASVTTPGSYTVLPPLVSGGVAVTGGTGSGATLDVGYTITGVSLTPGSGYLNTPPKIRWQGGDTAAGLVSTTKGFNWELADIALTMTPALAPLILDGSVIVNSVPQKLKDYAVSGLPTCNAGAKFNVAAANDASSPSYGAPVAGGGSAAAKVMCNGTNWIVN